MARDDLDEEEDGNDSDKSDLIGGERPRRRNRHYDYDEDDEDEYDEDEDDEEDAIDHNLLPLPAGFMGQPVTCPCCLPNNNIGFTCPDGVRLEPLPANATFGDYYARLQPQPGHLQCPNCRKHLPVIPEAQGDIADRFRCKFKNDGSSLFPLLNGWYHRANYLAHFFIICDIVFQAKCVMWRLVDA